MSAFRVSLPLLVACAAFALPTLSGNAVAKDPAPDLDTLAYGSLDQAASSNVKKPNAPKREPSVSDAALPSSVSGGLLAAIGLATPQSPVRASVAPARAMPAYSGGLLSAIGLDGEATPVTTSTSVTPAVAPARVVSHAPQIAAPPRVVVRPMPAPMIAVPIAAPPPVIVAERIPAPSPVIVRASPQNSDGLLAAFGLRSDVVADPLQANAQISVAYPSPVSVTRELDYRIDAGDKLRVVVYGQEGLTNTYAIDAGGGLTMPLIGRVEARGLTPVGLAAHITARLRKGYIREPSVAVEIESYRPFFILGEVAAPGQYPYVPNMSVEAAVAIAGGFSPRARRDSVIVTHQVSGGQLRAAVPLGTPLSPGDTVTVGERWF